MKPADIPTGLAFCRASRWNQTAGEWRLFLDQAPDGAVVAERGGRVVGTAVLLPYGSRLAWVAMVLVDPAERGRGIGRALLDHAIALGRDGQALRLDATPEGRRLYATLGFRDEYGLARYRNPSPALHVRGAASPLGPHDWEEVLRLDRAVFGADRRAVLAWCHSAAPEYAWVTRSSHGVEGFVLGRHGHDADHIGPVVACDAEQAAALVAASLARQTPRTVSIDVPDAQSGFRDWVLANGFVLERPFTRMVRGTLDDAGQPSRVFAIAGPELG